MKKALLILLALAHHASAAPTAAAGSDIQIADTNDDLSVLVRLDGSASTDSGDPIVSWDWSWGTSGTASGETVDVPFPAIDAPVTVTLTVTDSSTFTSTDTVEVSIYRKETALFVDFPDPLYVSTGSGLYGKLAGDTLIIDYGNVDAFRKSGSTWAETEFPFSKSDYYPVDEDTVLSVNLGRPSVPFPFDATRFENGQWIRSSLTADVDVPGVTIDNFNNHRRLGADPDTVVVSDYESNFHTTEGGQAFVYDWAGTQLTFLQEVTPPGGFSVNGKFGSKIVVDGDLMAVSEGSTQIEDIHLYRKSGGTWSHEVTFNRGSGFFPEAQRIFTPFDLNNGILTTFIRIGTEGFFLVYEKVGPTWIETQIPANIDGSNFFFSAYNNIVVDSDGESFAASNKLDDIVLMTKDIASATWSVSAATTKPIQSSDLAPGGTWVSDFENGNLTLRDGSNGLVRLIDTNTAIIPINAEPVADAGADIVTTSFSGNPVTTFLNGGGSVDLDGQNTLEARWTWEGGSATGLLTFAAIPPAVTEITLTVTDDGGAVSSDTIQVQIEAPPVIEAGPDAVIVDTDGDGNILLNVSGSVISQDNPIVSWNWRWPGGTFNGQSGTIVLEEPADGEEVILEVVDSNGLLSQTSFIFNLLDNDPTPDIVAPIDGRSGDSFGFSTLIDGGTAFVAAPGKDVDGATVGGAYQFININDVWQQIPLDPGESFGGGFAINGDFLFALPREFSGANAVRIYQRQGNLWNHLETITPATSEAINNFGKGAATEGEYLVLSGTSGVEVYRNIAGTWTFEQGLTKPADANPGNFGSQIAISGERIAVVSLRAADNFGIVYVYEKIGGTWTHVASLTNSESPSPEDWIFDRFGTDVAMNDTEILVSAPAKFTGTPFTTTSSPVYRFSRIGGTWQSSGIIFAEAKDGGPAPTYGGFGDSMWLKDDVLTILAPNDFDNTTGVRGSIHTYQFSAGSWVKAGQVTLTTTLDPEINFSLTGDSGNALYHDGRDMILGSVQSRNSAGVNTGKAYIYRNYAALNPNANYEPLADAGGSYATTDSIVRDGVTDEIIEPLGSEVVTLDGSGSTDQESAMATWIWTWDDTSASGEIVNARFPVGTTTVTLTVTDDLGIVNTDTATVTVTLNQTAPAALASTAGNTFTVDLPVAAARWRLSNEFLWHESNETITGIVPGETYQVEVLGFPGSTERITALATPQAGNSVADFNLILPLPAGTNGKISFPETEVGFSWRLTGEDTWRDVTDNNDEVEDALKFTLPTGPTLIEFKPVPGYITPSPRVVTVQQGVTQGLNWGDYSLISNFDNAKTFDLVTSPDFEDDPYQYVGMIRTPLGRATGTVVADRVVLTAAHPFFNFEGLKWENTQWFPRQQQDSYQAPPVAPRGILYRTSYAKLIAPDSVPGTVANLPEDIQEVDFACLYFNDATWTGGSANFLQSTAEQNWLTGSENKHAAGYAQRNQVYPERGRLFDKTFTTPLTGLDTLGKLYESSQLFGDGGASGSALFVEPAGTGQFYPAAILLAGQNRAVYRAIDLDVTRMIKDAADTASGNGDVLDSNSSLVTFDSLGSFATLGISVAPSEIQQDVRWAVTPNAGAGFANIAPFQTVPFNPDWDDFTLTFNAVPGYATPDPIVRSGSSILPSTSNTFSAVYEPLSGYDTWKQDNLLASDDANGDGDIWIALWEYALDLDPGQSDFRDAIRPAQNPTQSVFAEFEVYVSATADAIRYEILAADSADDLKNGINLTSLGTFTKADGASNYLAVTDTQPISASQTRFARVIITHDRSLSGP